MMNILVTGGAGYIGSAAVKALVEKGYNVIVVDNLSKGSFRLVDKKAVFYKLDLVDKKALEKVFSENKINSVMHFAANKSVEESMENAPKYSDNITGTINLLDVMVKFNVKKIIYSSSAAVYGIPKEPIVDENSATNPINYYGYTKLASENIIKWYSKIHNLGYIILRYFNVAGDAGLHYIDPNARNIFPIIMEVLSGRRDKLVIFGNDYSTADGTCVRDYIDINDLVRAHILALDVTTNEIINLGTSKGVSVKQLVDAVIEVTGKKFKFEYGKRRKGDPEKLVASNEKARKVLGWQTSRNIKDMIKSMLEAYSL